MCYVGNYSISIWILCIDTSLQGSTGLPTDQDKSSSLSATVVLRSILILSRRTRPDVQSSNYICISLAWTITVTQTLQGPQNTILCHRPLRYRLTIWNNTKQTASVLVSLNSFTGILWTLYRAVGTPASYSRVSTSNVGPKTGYCHWNFSWFFRVSPGKATSR